MQKPFRLFITGKPGCGKTTIIKHLGHHLRLSGYEICGFYTEEIRKEGSRTGFIIKTWDGTEALLAHKDAKSPYTVGKYKVLVENIDSVALPSMNPPSENTLILIDEIGKMECLSQDFCRKILSIMEAPNPLIATVPIRGGKFVERIKSMPGAVILVLDPGNRENLRDELLRRVIEYVRRKGE
ncbi:NTPase [Thermodesulforhabdus norvegica]|uniref:Nucleoside-triphosphatase n=1 Tax=Thermodesulforhabdus norvegica TaxID=39841 RepID=A0A1I4UC72_9BACT|nr:NTPase [Thermodesulforhabdus norvegica]SFM86558.1 nucleoside-triphosphatase [Thermodesulforhabdus norvegica]